MTFSKKISVLTVLCMLLASCSEIPEHNISVPDDSSSTESSDV